jgi:hypothetical protein
MSHGGALVFEDDSSSLIVVRQWYFRCRESLSRIKGLNTFTILCSLVRSFTKGMAILVSLVQTLSKGVVAR